MHRRATQMNVHHPLNASMAANCLLDSLRGPSVKIGTIQRRLAWPLRKDDTHKSRSVNNFFDPFRQLRQLITGLVCMHTATTVAILAQGTHWAVATLQAFLPRSPFRCNAILISLVGFPAAGSFVASLHIEVMTQMGYRKRHQGLLLAAPSPRLGRAEQLLLPRGTA